jgi:hypothetical protein
MRRPEPGLTRGEEEKIDGVVKGVEGAVEGRFDNFRGMSGKPEVDGVGVRLNFLGEKVVEVGLIE